MGVQEADASELALERQGLTLELDDVVAEDLRSYVGLGCLLDVLMTELEHDLRLADRKPVLVPDASAQDEGVIVKAEVRSVDEQDFADLNRRVLARADRERHVVLIGRLSQDLREVEEALARSEAVWFENELAAQVLKLVKRQAIGIAARLELRDPSRPCRFRRDGGFGHALQVLCK